MEVLGEFAKYAFCGLKRKRRDFERSVLRYVSIKIPALTHSGRKRRVCVNQPDRLIPNHIAARGFCLPNKAGTASLLARVHRARGGAFLDHNF